MSSTAPALIYRDSDLIKRAIRDLYHREIDEVIVEGEEGYKAAKGFMKLLMPSHVRRVKLHSESTPSFQRYGVEDQLSAMYQPVVQLKSGGYLVINPTEALVSIDINSGRSTREHNIEQTAYNTNLEAAQEIARQLRLRDMAGLIVIDFIDMEQNSHVRKVEKAMKEALKNDRARIQVGRISSFGLMEMSRQRLRTGVLEASTKPCPHCEGTGLMRTAASAGLSALRILEDEAARGRGERITLRAGKEAAVYVLNKKRAELADIEQRYGVMIDVQIDESLEGARMSVDSSGPRPVAVPRAEAPAIEEEEEFEDEALEAEDEDEDEEIEAREPRRPRESEAEGDQPGRRRRRRRRGGRGRNRREGGDSSKAASQSQPKSLRNRNRPKLLPKKSVGDEPREGGKRRRRRRGRGGASAEAPETDCRARQLADDRAADRRRTADCRNRASRGTATQASAVAQVGGSRSRGRSARARARARAAPAEAPPAQTAEDEQPAPKAAPRTVEEGCAKPRRRRQPSPLPRHRPTTTRPKTGPSEPRRSGWWQRTFG